MPGLSPRIASPPGVSEEVSSGNREEQEADREETRGTGSDHPPKSGGPLASTWGPCGGGHRRAGAVEAQRRRGPAHAESLRPSGAGLQQVQPPALWA